MHTLLRRPGFWIAIVLLTAAIAVGTLCARGPKVQTVVAVRKDLEQHVVASGRVWVEGRVQVSAQVPGLVVAVGAIEGQHVKMGSLLVQFDDAEARAAVAQAKAAVDQASARVDQLRRVGAIVATEGLNQAESNLERAQVEHERTAKLFATGTVAPRQCAPFPDQGHKVTASKDGVILARSVERGDVVQPARTLLVLAIDGDVQSSSSPTSETSRP